MARKPSPDNPPCPRCGATRVVKNGSKDGRPHWVCRVCNRSFGPTLSLRGEARLRRSNLWYADSRRQCLRLLRHTPTEVALALRVVMRRGSLIAAEELTGHKYETIGRWLRLAGTHADRITDALVHDLHLTAVEVDAFWSFVKRSARQVHRRGWARVGDA